MFWPSLCTIKESDGAVTSSGRPDPTYSAVAGMEGIPCRRAPLTLNQPAEREKRQEHKQRGTEEYHIFLQSMFVSITGDMVAEVDGVQYGIVGLEHDGQKTQTRLRVRRDI
jgi:hypothetical protein